MPIDTPTEAPRRPEQQNDANKPAVQPDLNGGSAAEAQKKNADATQKLEDQNTLPSVRIGDAAAAANRASEKEPSNEQKMANFEKAAQTFDTRGFNCTRNRPTYTADGELVQQSIAGKIIKLDEPVMYKSPRGTNVIAKAGDYLIREGKPGEYIYRSIDSKAFATMPNSEFRINNPAERETLMTGKAPESKEIGTKPSEFAIGTRVKYASETHVIAANQNGRVYLIADQRNRHTSIEIARHSRQEFESKYNEVDLTIDGQQRTFYSPKENPDVIYSARQRVDGNIVVSTEPDLRVVKLPSPAPQSAPIDRARARIGGRGNTVGDTTVVAGGSTDIKQNGAGGYDIATGGTQAANEGSRQKGAEVETAQLRRNILADQTTTAEEKRQALAALDASHSDPRLSAEVSKVVREAKGFEHRAGAHATGAGVVILALAGLYAKNKMENSVEHNLPVATVK